MEQHFLPNKKLHANAECNLLDVYSCKKQARNVKKAIAGSVDPVA